MDKDFIKKNAHNHEVGEDFEKDLYKKLEEERNLRKRVDMVLLFLILVLALYVTF